VARTAGAAARAWHAHSAADTATTSASVATLRAKQGDHG